MFDPSTPDYEPRGSFQRTQRLIDPRWQLGIASVASLTLLGTGALYLVGSELLASPRVTSTIGPAALPYFMLGCDIAFFLAVVALVHHVVVRMTLSVVGPALVVERGLRAMAEGRLDARFTVREADYLVSLAESASELQDELARQRAVLTESLDAVEAAAGAHPDVRAAIARVEAELRFERPERGHRKDDSIAA